jgi:CheY-like chemotaxis protein
MGGRIWVDSAPGAGAAFHFVLPLLEARRDARPHPEAPACATCPAASALLDPATCGTEPPPTGLRASTGEPLRVLLVEDEPVSRLVALRALQSLGLEVGVAENGDEALQALARGGVDVVLMDMQMPRLNGEDATRRLRSGQVRGANRDVPVIGVSAFAQPRDRERALAAGMNDYLTKPYEIETLVRAVERQTGRNLRLPKETGGPDGLEKAY